MSYGKNINKALFEKYCKIMCTKQEICDLFEVSPDTLELWCKQEYGDTPLHVINRYANAGKQRLRQIQMDQAEKNPTMAIWLGKQYLGQSDKVEQQTDTRVIFVDDMDYEDDEDSQNGNSEV